MRRIPHVVFSLLFIICSFYTLKGQIYSEWIIESNQLNPTKVSGPFKNIEKISKLKPLYAITLNQATSKSSLKNILDKTMHGYELYPNYEITYRNVPNDKDYDSQWSLTQLDMESAWALTTGGLTRSGSDIVMAILDDGFQLNHEDLSNVFWTNPHEIPNDGIDNDGNGYIDDFLGLNIETNNSDHLSLSHGTQVAGIMGASTNNGLGIAGINWNARILPISGVSNIAEIIKGLEYLYFLKKEYLESNGTRGANIVVNNFSGGLYGLFPNDAPDWCEQYELLGSVGIISVSAVANNGVNLEVSGDLPTLCTSEHLIMVTNASQDGTRISDAGFGRNHVDIAAPGELVLSTETNNKYFPFNGTSASAPHVAGAIGLIHSLDCPIIDNISLESASATAQSIINAIMKGAVEDPSFSQTVSGGRLNVYNALREMSDNCLENSDNPLQVSKVYPNPISRSDTKCEITIDFFTDTFNDNHEIVIYNTSGQLVYMTRFDPYPDEKPSFTFRLNNTNLAPGILYLGIRNSFGQSNLKSLLIEE